MYSVGDCSYFANKVTIRKNARNAEATDKKRLWINTRYFNGGDTRFDINHCNNGIPMQKLTTVAKGHAIFDNGVVPTWNSNSEMNVVGWPNAVESAKII